MSPLATTALVVRNYQPGDILRHLVPEYAQFELTPELCWVAEEDGAIVAVMVATYGHQVATVLRVASHPSASPTALLRVMRHGVQKLREMGCMLLIICLSETRPEELKIARLLLRAGGQLSGISGFVGALPTTLAGRW